MLNMAKGVLEDDCLTVVCRDDFTMSQLNNETITTVLRDVTAEELGRPIRVQLRVGQLTAAPAKRPAPPKPAPPPPREEAPAPPPPPRPAETPPWEAPADKPDKLNELLQNGQQLDNFQIK